MFKINNSLNFYLKYTTQILNNIKTLITLNHLTYFKYYQTGTLTLIAICLNDAILYLHVSLYLQFSGWLLIRHIICQPFS